MLAINNLSKTYRTTKALNDVSCHIPKGKMTAILGENGSGKSTLLNLITKQIHQDCGDITLDSNDIEGICQAEYAKRIACLKQIPKTLTHIKVIDLVSFGRYPFSKGKMTSKDYQIVHESMRLMACEELQDRFVDTLSGGQLQRVYVAMILAQDTPVILLDEPLNHLDVRHAHQLMKLLQDLVLYHGKTIALVVHDINVAFRYCDHVIALRDGVKLCEGKPCEVLDESQLRELLDIEFELIHHHEHIVAYLKGALE